MGGRQWVRVRSQVEQKPPELEKAAITAACERFLAEVLRPRFLPEIRPTSFNYPVPSRVNGMATDTASCNASALTIRTRASPSSMHRLRVWSMSAATALMCPGIAIQVSGFVSTALFPSSRPCS